MQYTFMNGGTPYSFRVNKYSKNLNQRGRSTLLKIHAELTLNALRNGNKDVFIMDQSGRPLNKRDLKECVATGKPVKFT